MSLAVAAVIEPLTAIDIVATDRTGESIGLVWTLILFSQVLGIMAVMVAAALLAEFFFR